MRMAVALLPLFAAAHAAEPCSALPTALADAGMVLQTEPVEAGMRLQAGPPGAPPGPALAAHCRVSGRMAQRIGQDGKPYHIGFELRLPLAWNGRFLYQGGGGNDGVIRPAIGAQATLEPALNQGFAVVSTDAGHQTPTADFGFDPQARLDNAYVAHDRVATAAKLIVQRHYGRPADRTYFIGCSGGGRQGMMFTQRFPEHFDGVIAMAPAMRVSKGATIAAAWDTQTLQAIAPRGSDGLPVLSQALTDNDLATLRQGILKACDADDGVADGLVSHPAACRFQVQALQCKAGVTEGCLAAPKVQALQRIMAGARNSRGEPLYFSWPWDAGMGHPANDWRAWKLGNSPTSRPNAINATMMQDALQGYFVTPPDRSLDILRFDFDRDPARMDAYSWVFNTADDVTLARYKARGGKLLLAHGLADPIFSPHESIDYMQRLQAEHGAAAGDFSRLFLVPGMGHCQGGAATDQWDGLGALVAWVEKGQAPAQVMAQGSRVFAGRSRPLCPWPQYARYTGQGDVEDGRNFRCAAPAQ
ncbi:MAG: hypothetical protein RL026_86 [Pseudomonadota bacterium]